MTIDATDLLRQAETYLAITHEQAARHDILGAAFSCSGCELRKRIAALLAQPDAAPSVPADADQCTEIRDTVDRLRAERDQARTDLSASHDDLTDALGADPDAEWTDLIRLAARQRARVAELSIRAVQTDAWAKKPAHFDLVRDVDISGVSGTGKVAEGVIFSDGEAVIHWLGAWPTTTVHPKGTASIKAVHGHGGATRIVLNDPADRLGRIADAHRPHTAEGGTTSGDCNECGEPSPCPTYVWATTDRDPLATWDPADDQSEAEPCSVCLLPRGDAPVERCIVEGSHETHVAATGRRWKSTDDGDAS